MAEASGSGPMPGKPAEKSELAAALFSACATLGVKHITYLLAPNSVHGVHAHFVRTTYPADWVARYLTSSYFDLDPVVVRGLSSRRPFFWSAQGQDSPQLRAMFEEAQGHGLGEHGYSVPIADTLGLRALVTLNYSGGMKSWRRLVAERTEEIHQLADTLHALAIKELGIRAVERPITPREAECLYWCARGKDAATIASILEISEHTARDHLKMAKRKLDCSTLAQAIHKAVALKLIGD